MIILYGATGYTGRLCAKALDAAGHPWAIAGRSRDKLTALAGSLTSAPEVRVADADDRHGLRAAFAGARVVLSCAGPFARLGPPAQDAALEVRAHWLDVTGEQDFMRATYARDALARERGVALVNAVGFDVVPTDLALHLAGRGLGLARQAELALAAGGSASRGTRRSALSIAQAGGVGFDDGAWHPEPLARHRRTAPFPAPLGPRAVWSAPTADIATAPRTTGAPQVRIYVRLPERVASVLPWLDRVRPVLGWPLVGRLADAWIERLPEGPPEEARSGARFSIWARIEAVDGRAGEVTATGRDPYGLTAVTATHAALRFARDPAPPVGALTPVQALDPAALEDLLASVGTRFEVVAFPASVRPA